MTVTKQQTNEGTTRRRVLKGIAATIGLAGVGFVTKRAINYLITLPENISALSLKGNKVKDQSGSIYSDETYLEFRGTVFRLYSLEARIRDGIRDNPTRLVRKAHSLYSPIELDLHNFARAEDLFNVVNTKAVNLDGLTDGEIKSFGTQIPATPLLKENYFYQVPVKTTYKSLGDILAAYKR